MINRNITQSIIANLFKRKAIIIYGPRQSGKTTLLQMLKEKISMKILVLDGDEPDVRQKLTDVTSSQLRSIIS